MSNTASLPNTYFVIMAGGVGARFWPASRENLPKQFLDILGTGRSLLQMTRDRIAGLVPPEQIIILTHEKYKNLVREHLPDLPSENILTEPSRNNTAPCVAYVSLHINARHPDAGLVILPADHVITREIDFQRALTTAVEYVSDHDSILTLGMKPHRPDTGYGYIELAEELTPTGIRRVRSFTEKPDRPTALRYLAEDRYVWNAGIFISSVRTMIAAFRRHASEIYERLWQPDIYGSPEEDRFIRKNYPRTPSISLDYAIMEKADNIVCRPADIGWSDVGTWKSLYSLQSTEEGDIVHNLPNDGLIAENSESLMIYGEGEKKIIVRGLKDMMIIDKKDVLLIWPLEEEQAVKDIRERFNEKFNSL